MSTTRAALRLRVGRLIGDPIVVTATSGTSTTAVDLLKLGAIPDSTLLRREVIFSGPAADANIGLIRRVTANVGSTGTITLHAALTETVASGDTLELYNKQDQGATIDEIHDAINRAIESVAGSHLTDALSSTSVFASATPTLTVPATWKLVVGPERQDANGEWRRIDVADQWELDRAGLTVQILDPWRNALEGLTVRLRGYTAPAALSAETSTTTVDAEYVVHRAAADLLFATMDRRSPDIRNTLQFKYQLLDAKAEGLRPMPRTRLAAGSRALNPI